MLKNNLETAAVLLFLFRNLQGGHHRLCEICPATESFELPIEVRYRCCEHIPEASPTRDDKSSVPWTILPTSQPTSMACTCIVDGQRLLRARHEQRQQRHRQAAPRKPVPLEHCCQ